MPMKDLFAVVAVLVAVLVAALAPRAWQRLEDLSGKLAARRTAAIVAVGLFPLVVRALLLPVLPAPEPRTHDEFSYLVAADTFAHGRLTNPVHPFAMHFETIHILMRPRYVSVFPIAQGLALAAGQVLFGHPWAGVWISVGLMSAAVCWALQGWLSPGWALFGSWLFALRLGIFSYWMNSYWGGAVAALGGALVVGALPRMLSRRSKMDAVWMGLGLAILANSRPFEGLVFALLMLGIACWKAKAVPVIWPAALVVAAAAAGMSYYFWQATGNPLRVPYVLYRSGTAAPHFVFQSPRPTPVFHHDVFRNFSEWEMYNYRTARAETLPGRVWERAVTYWRFFFGLLFSVPLAMLAWRWKDRDVGLLAAAAGLFFLIALVPQVWQAPHYAAPAAALFALLVIMGMRALRGLEWRGKAVGRLLVRALPLAAMVTLVINASDRNPAVAGSRWAAWGGDPTPRASILKRLKESGGRHIVLVRYAPQHDVHNEWVYNDADIDAAPVAWAREMGPLRDGGLLRYFGGRKVWLAEPDATPPRISPYPVETVQDAGALEQALRQRALEQCGTEPCRWTCDQWNWMLVKVTGRPGPSVDTGCMEGNDRNAAVSFEHWFAWLEGQR